MQPRAAALPYKIMHGLWGMGQMIPRLRDQIHHRGGRRDLADGHHDMHNTSEVLFRLCANTDPQRDSIFIPQSRDPSDVLDHATSPAPAGPAAANSALMRRRKLPGEGFKRPWPPLIKVDAAVKAKVEKLFNP